MDLLQGRQESLFKTGILGSYGLKNLAVNVENYLSVRNWPRVRVDWRLTHVVLLHGRKGVEERFNIGHSVLRVGSDA